MKTTIIISAAALGLGTALAVHAAETPSADVLPPTYIVHQLVGLGYDVREVEFEDGVYEAEVRNAEGKIVDVEIDPISGALLSAAPAPAPQPDPSVAVNAAAAIETVALAGYWDITELDWKNGAYRIRARDDAGSSARFTVDGRSGQILESKARINR